MNTIFKDKLEELEKLYLLACEQVNWVRKINKYFDGSFD